MVTIIEKFFGPSTSKVPQTYLAPPPPTPLADLRPYDLSNESLPSVSQLSSKFFTSLSAELRIAILTAAFGDCTLHLHFHDNRPWQTINKKEKKLTFSRWRKNQTPPKPTLTGTLCNRIRTSKDRFHSNDPGVFNDTCHASYPHDPERPDDSRNVGALGWLLSCRQAYIEGIDILYSTNTFRISSPYLAANLPSFLLPQRLATVKTLELNLKCPNGTWDITNRHTIQFEIDVGALCDNIPDLFPRLTKLQVAFRDNLYPRHHDDPSVLWVVIEARILRSMDCTIAALSTLEEPCKMFFTRSVFLGLMEGWEMKVKERAMEGKDREMEMELVERGKLWRGVGENDKRYWICKGRDDSPRVVCCF